MKWLNCFPVQELENLSGNAGTRLRLENEKLKREVSELRKLVSASGAIAGPSSSSDMPSTSRVTQLEEELAQAKETISSKSFLVFGFFVQLYSMTSKRSDYFAYYYKLC